MSKSAYLVAAFALLLLVGVGILYSRNEQSARVVAERALSDLRSGEDLALYKRDASRSTWVVGVRTEEGDAAAEIRKAGLTDPDAKGREAGSGETVRLALLESAGARVKCNLTGGVIPVSDNPWATETLAGPEIMTVARTMAAKGDSLAAAGRFDDAQKELFLLLSVGDHLAADYSLSSLALGLSLQDIALEALQRLYATRGAAMAMEGVEAGRIRDSLSRKRKALSSLPSFMNISMTSEGRALLKVIAEDHSLDRAIRSEAIMALSAGHLFHMNRVLFGPEAERKAMMGELRLEDPVLAEISANGQKTILTMSVTERKEARSHASAMR